MVRQQKCAWFVVAVVLAMVLAVVALIPVAGKGAWGGLGLFGLTGFTNLLFRKRKEPKEVDLDERDTAIAQKAVIAGGMASYLVFVVACMAAWFVCMARGQKDISIHYLALVVACGAITLMAVKSVVTLVLYGSEAHDGGD